MAAKDRGFGSMPLLGDELTTAGAGGWGEVSPLPTMAKAGAQTHSPTILIIDDDESVVRRLSELLHERLVPINILTAGDGALGLRTLADETVDLVLCDLAMPSMDGMQLLDLKATEPELSDIPVLLMTATAPDAELRTRAFDAGALDFLVEPCDEAELVARVKANLKIRALAAELKRRNAQLEELVRVDPLTKIANRRYLDEVLAREFSRAARYQAPLAHMMVDIDHFKAINDAFGHQVGDQILVHVADVLASDSRTYDVVGRYGGEEFSILLPQTSLGPARAVAERHRLAIESCRAVTAHGLIGVTISLGVAAWPSVKVGCAQDLVRLSDTALYEAKHKGRNRVELAA
jgi:two-component system, cell cycle response regulator